MSPRKLSTAVVLAPILFFSSCVSWETPPATQISSTPPGARVIVDGQNSGYLTPCLVDLDVDQDHRLRIELAGYVPEEVLLRENGDAYLIPWELGSDSPYGWSSPMFLGAVDLFAPLRIDGGLSPDRVHVQLDQVTTDR